MRNGTLRAAPRTQSSIAVAGTDPAAWALVNASPDILTQLRVHADLQPARAPRDTGIAGIVLVDAQIDHTAGLFMLRESTAPLAIWCTDAAYADLTGGNPIFRVLGHYCGVERCRMGTAGEEFSLERVPGVRWRAIAVAGKPAPYSPHRDAQVPGDNVALVISDAASGKAAVYAPAVGAIEPALWSALEASACVLIDGTFWSDAEMIAEGLGAKRARDMGHLPQSGPGGMLAWLERLPRATRKILIHVNNSNPILDEDSPERAALSKAGVEVAWDGMEIEV